MLQSNPKFAQLEVEDLFQLLEIVCFAQTPGPWRFFASNFFSLNVKDLLFVLNYAAPLKTSRDALGRRNARLGNLWLIEWNFKTNSFKTMIRFAVAKLTLFCSSYSCDSLLLHMNFIKFTTRDRLSLGITAACVKLKTTHYHSKL